MSRHTTAVAFAVASLAIATFSAMDAVMKGLSIGLGAYNAMLWRTLAGLLIAGAVYFARRAPWPAASVLRLHLRRGVLTAVMALLFFWGLARVPLAQGVALSFVAPLIALYLAALLLKEKIERTAVLASLLGFAGVIVILAGQAQAEMGPDAFRGAIAILLSALIYAYNIILMRRQALVAGPVEIAFFMNVIPASCFLLAAPFLAVVPGAELVPHIFGAAALAFASLLLLSWAYARAEAQHLAPVEYTAFVWAAFFGLTVFGEPVRPMTLAGAAMIVLACLIAARRRSAPAADVEAAI
jgi:S-adenosylmethionine uptake transporter